MPLCGWNAQGLYTMLIKTNWVSDKYYLIFGRCIWFKNVFPNTQLCLRVRQYFDQIPGVATDELPSYGGAVEIADYCPFSQEFSWHLSGEYQRNSYCRVRENQPGTSTTCYLKYILLLLLVVWPLKCAIVACCIVSAKLFHKALLSLHRVVHIQSNDELRLLVIHLWSFGLLKSSGYCTVLKPQMNN